ncbi:MurR/RpiR family transcriptional regulator [Commensalibacter oyaizuii]|uniref:MurR/RpiR family transcriptional regulator n=1 Tax=Commensalibacter oyaizuii TaxID=3043873 RepID=A0ABT6Q318_9PROT|nr:MurR/RpiR family transcriptional regulator [Commensalibacter sp. TBRC 16381]MDI2091383.1 MurR/RpiR family transcriptional regulator [Commensalibacter sp. TBRC 16381]
MKKVVVKKSAQNVSTLLPDNFHDLHQLILERKDSFPKRLIQIAEFLISTPSYTIAFGKITEIAKEAGVQPSALVRFAKNIGYSGFSELQAIFRDHASRFWPDYSERIQNIDQHTSSCNDLTNPKALLRGFIESAHHSIDILEHNMDYQRLDEIVNLLADAETICFIGAERLYSVVVYMTYIFRRAGIRCEYANDAGSFARNQIDLLSKNDVVLAMSYTPYASRTLELVFHAADLGIPIAAITDSSFSPLVHKSTTWLEVTEANYAGFRSLTATFSLASMLAVAISQKRMKKI